jgi:hypothetical protein
LWNKYIPQFEPGGVYTLPVVDEDDNTYLILPMNTYWDETETTMVVAFDKHGHIRWEKNFEGRHRGNITFLDATLFFLVSQYTLTENQSILYSIKRGCGEILFQKDLEIDLEDDTKLFSNSNHLCIRTEEGVGVYNFQGVEQWNVLVQSSVTAAAQDSALYILIDNQKIRKYAHGNNVWEWEWQAEDMSSLNNIKFGEEQSLYIKGDNKMYVLSSDGLLSRSFSFDVDGYSYQINGDEIIVGGERVSKYDKEGFLQWEVGVLKNFLLSEEFPDFTIASNGYIYIGHSLGLTAISSEGEQLWHVGYQNDIVQLMQPVLNYNGDIICFSPEKLSIQCIKGDGSPPQ